MTNRDKISSNQCKLRLIEFLLLALVLPTILIVEQWGRYMFFFLWAATIYCLIAYYFTKSSKTVPVWRWSEVTWVHLRPILIRFGISSVLLLIFISMYDPERRFDLITHRTDMWARLMLLYPVLSALPQEFIFCTFFFARYSCIFNNHRKMMAASSIIFAYVHVLFINPVAPLLTIIAGYFFASTFAKHKSLALVTIEHALYGNMVFTLGLGWYFWGRALH
jgi:hypothetical protein